MDRFGELSAEGTEDLRLEHEQPQYSNELDAAASRFQRYCDTTLCATIYHHSHSPKPLPEETSREKEAHAVIR